MTAPFPILLSLHYHIPFAYPTITQQHQAPKMNIPIPKTLTSNFLSPFSHYNSHPSKFPFIKYTTKPPTATSPTPAQQLDPDNPSAPTPGQLLIEKHQAQAQNAATAITTTEATTTKKKRKKKVKMFVKNTLPCCYGCGAILSPDNEVDSPGYVDPETYALKKKHRQLKTVLCGRCRLLSQGHMITAVGGHGGYAGGKQFVTAEQLRQQLAHLKHEKVLIVKLVDIVDFHGSFLSRVRDLAGANPIILVVTKIDLLPKGTDLNCVGDWVVEATTKKKLNVLGVHLTSSKSLVGIAGVVADIRREKKGRDVYIMGSANVGKSAFISAVLNLMGEIDPIAASALRYKPIQSAVPGTTLGPIEIDAFLGGGKIYDTPGVHLHHRQAAVVHSDDLASLAPRSRLKGRSFPNPQALRQDNNEIISSSSGLEGFSIFWGGLVRVDILQVPPQSRLTFFGPTALQIHVVRTEEADEFYKRELGSLLTPPTGKQNVESWEGLESQRNLHLTFDNMDRPPCDIAVSGLGWIAVEPIRKLTSSDSDTEQATYELRLNVHVPKPVEIFVRQPLPVGKAGSEWYEYRELTEAEEETRPKWHF